MLKPTPQKKSVLLKTKNVNIQTNIKLTSVVLKTAIKTKSYKVGNFLVMAAMIFGGFLLPYNLVGVLQPATAGASQFVYINGYQTLNGNYIDCDGSIDNDMGHHVTNPADTDIGHHLGLNCSGSAVTPQVSAPITNSSTTGMVYVNGYQILNGNYIDCDGSIDNDMGHHVTNPADTDPGHHLGLNCGSVAPSVQVAPVAVAAPVAAPTAPSGNNLFSGAKLFVDPNSDSANWVKNNPYSSQVNLMKKVAAGAETQWFGNWNSNVQQDVSSFVTQAVNAGALPTLVAYNIPNRDCGGYSSGGASPDAYRQWIRQFAAGLGGHKAAVILEPDATALITCLSSTDLQTRYRLLSDAVSVLKSAGASVYIDAGHPSWISASDMAGRLNQAGISNADGFALNVSNFYTTGENISYGQQISSLVGDKHFVIDTGRNGNGSNGDWCNPSGRALGQLPTTNTGNSLVDAYLWVKGPSGSDGQCNGGPSAGIFWPQYAMTLAQNANW